MESFHWLTIPLSTILGIGITRLLTSAVVVFKSRSSATLSRLPLVWAGCIFLLQLQFWWALTELPKLIKAWTLGYFVLFISLPLLLFLASALILPHQQLSEGQKLRDEFRTDGQWALVCLSLYFTLALTVDFLLWKVDLHSLLGLQDIALIFLPLLCARCRSLKAQKIVTVIFLVVVLWATIFSSPSSY